MMNSILKQIVRFVIVVLVQWCGVYGDLKENKIRDPDPQQWPQNCPSQIL
jgi:hypothetical protein